jgi:hypothetical protein
MRSDCKLLKMRCLFSDGLYALLDLISHDVCTRAAHDSAGQWVAEEGSVSMYMRDLLIRPGRS